MREATDAELGIRPRDSAELVCAEMIGYFPRKQVPCPPTPSWRPATAPPTPGEP
jgi:hypothetical protein